MQTEENGYVFSDDKSMISLDGVCALLKQSYWAAERSRETTEKSIENSICWGVYKDGEQVGFARIITDHATTFYVCDVIIHEKHREHGLGKRIVELAVNSDEYKDLFGILATRDAHGLYEKFGFTVNQTMYMSRRKG